MLCNEYDYLGADGVDLGLKGKLFALLLYALFHSLLSLALLHLHLHHRSGVEMVANLSICCFLRLGWF